MDINEILNTIEHECLIGDQKGNGERCWEFSWWMCVHCAEY